MTPNEINEAIALSLGYQFLPREIQEKRGFVEIWCMGCWSNGKTSIPLLRYYSSLDSCSEFTSALDGYEEQYMFELLTIIGADKPLPKLTFLGITATAPQRCEAYLRLKGLWIA